MSGPTGVVTLDVVARIAVNYGYQWNGRARLPGSRVVASDALRIDVSRIGWSNGNVQQIGKVSNRKTTMM
jgi:hypothetical protein